jgi:N-methylhydantoinase A/oxoprolinase/acetone carboxylase beta subunit
MPDIISIGLGGGSIVSDDAIGPKSLGSAITERARIFGGDTLTATDLAVAGGRVTLGERDRLAGIDAGDVETGLQRIDRLIEDAVDRIKLRREDPQLIVVGGGSVLVGDRLAGVSRIVRPPDFDVANAVGAAIAQVSGEVDKIYPLAQTTRVDAVKDAQWRAVEQAVDAGAEPGSVQVVDVEEVPVAYMENAMVRIRVRAVGELGGVR